MTTYLSTPNRSGLQNFLFRIKIALYQFRSPAKVLFLITGLITSKLLLDYLVGSEILSRLNIPFDTIVGFFGVDQLHLVEHFIALFVATIVILIFAKPIDVKFAEKSLKQLGIPDKTGNNTPIFILNRRYKFRSKLRQILLFSNGATPDDFKNNDNLIRLGSKMGCFISGVETCGRRNDKLRVLYRKVDSNSIVKWENSYLSDKDFELVLGQKATGDFAYVNLNDSAHLLIAGSTGSGKSVLLSSLLMQSIRKGAKVVIAEFSKRGVDWTYWKNLKNCDVFTNPKDFSDFFAKEVVSEVEYRANLLATSGCKNISEYNAKVDSGEIDGHKLNRLIIALDEAGQVYISSRNKEQEELLKPIREAMDKLVREYRFCGIHLIIATQIPSSQIFSYEIRYLTDLKMCGISTKLLSEMVVDTDEAANIKQKGRFCTNNGETFQGFLFSETETLAEFKKD